MYQFGEVKDINDPEKLGRVKVSVYGFHDDIPVKELGWSNVVMPANTPATLGQGHSVNLREEVLWKTGDLLPNPITSPAPEFKVITDVAPDYTFDFAVDLLKQIGEKSKLLNQRITFHPGHFNVIGSPNPDVLQHTIDDLKYHADVLDLMELDTNSVMVIHGGGTYKNKELTKERWCENYLAMPENIRNRLVLENCEKNFSIIDCLDVSKKVNIPVVFDTHHFECYKKLHPTELFEEPAYYMAQILETWQRRNIKPKFHVSEQGSGKCGHHSDFIEIIPDYLLEIPEKYSVDIDIMIEAKMKEQAIFKLYEKYPYLNCKNE